MGLSALFAAAALWGFAEATLFFVVPDVLLSLVAVARGLRAGLRACLWAAAGALAGGLLMYAWAARDPEAARAAVAAVPLVTPPLVAAVQDDLAARGPLALGLGGVTGVPFKTFAVAAPAAGMGWASFLAAAALARLGRFALVTAAAWAVDRRFLGRRSLRLRLGLLAGIWALVYLGILILEA